MKTIYDKLDERCEALAIQVLSGSPTASEIHALHEEAATALRELEGLVESLRDDLVESQSTIAKLQLINRAQACSLEEADKLITEYKLASDVKPAKTVAVAQKFRRKSAEFDTEQWEKDGRPFVTNPDKYRKFVMATKWLQHDDHPAVCRYRNGKLPVLRYSHCSCCGERAEVHAYLRDTLVCPGDWIVEEKGWEVHVVTPKHFDLCFEPVLPESKPCGS